MSYVAYSPKESPVMVKQLEASATWAYTDVVVRYRTPPESEDGLWGYVKEHHLGLLRDAGQFQVGRWSICLVQITTIEPPAVFLDIFHTFVA